MSTYTSVHLAKRPKNAIVPGETFALKQNAMPMADELGEGEVIVRSLYLSLDPAMRGWLNDTRSYVPPVQIGEVMRGAAVGIVTASRSRSFPVGSYAMGTIGWTEYAKVKDKVLTQIQIPKNGKVTDALGVLGMTGLTAYFGILDIGRIRPGDFVVISGAAGATGSIVGQIAKLKGCTVLGLAGSDSKCDWLTSELGFDAALNYKSPTFAQDFRKATKSLIDVFFDNVGGEILDLALGRAKPHARFVMCGGISQYNTADAKGPKNYLMIVSMRIRMEGFIVFDYEKRFEEARRELAGWLAEGKIRRKEHIVKGGLAKAERALLDLYNGVNTGKLLVEVTPEEKAKL
ncbi:NADP-dependent leukotriene B4 12-hydroxydehydrogenase [Aulographum hederae CBS 113979]|uniref:NADP-dependent leukotriene B4 12-hydroxydehydrogenase n=1 Tax=Aulographum hederae CBS 113979 TaxID=1176131 RepID=A0A6G1H565_9PEZI|nr:NADP-dependent leukotriene B4 12-hydroxydehydrogenase [Aulographum hederae CBS 113979]